MPSHDANAKACLCDWDGTLRKEFMFENWIPYLVRSLGLAGEHETRFRMLFDNFKARRITYENLVDGVAQGYADCVMGLSRADVRSVASRFAKQDQAVFSFVSRLIARLSQEAIETIIVSGSPAEVLEAFAEILGIRRVFGLQIEYDEQGIYADRAQNNYGNYEQKLSCAMNLKERYSIKAAF